MNDSITALIDSSTPFLWLPTEICERIASALDLVWREDLGVYVFENGDQYLKYKGKKSTEELSFTFTVSSYDNSDDFGYPLNMPGVVNITIPPAAFAQVVRYPWKNVIKFNESSIPYFPLTRSTPETNNNQYIIGRVFMQEAYIITKYDKVSFSIHQALFPDNSATNCSIQVIERPPNSPYPEGTPVKKSSKKTLGVGQTVGIVVSAFVVGSVIGLILFCCCRRKSKAKKDQARKHLDHNTEEVAQVQDETTQSPVSRMLSRLVGRRRSRNQSTTQETEATMSEPVEVGADAHHQVFEMPVPPEPIELDNNDIGNDDHNFGLEGSREMSEYEAARLKLERQLQGPVPIYTPASEHHEPAVNESGYPNEKSVQDTSPVRYRPSEEPSPGSSPTYANTDSLPNSLPSPLSPNADWAAGRVFDLPSPMTVASPVRLHHFPTTAGFANPSSGHSPVSLHSPHSPHTYLPSPVSPSSNTHGASASPTTPIGGPVSLPGSAPIQRTPIDPTHTQIVCLGPMPENVLLPGSHHLRHSPTVPRIITPDGRLHLAEQYDPLAGHINLEDDVDAPLRRSGSVTHGSNETLGSNFTVEEESRMNQVQLAVQRSAAAQQQTSPISATSQHQYLQQPPQQRRRRERRERQEGGDDTSIPRDEEDLPRSPRSMERIEAGSELVHVPQVAAQRYSWEAETR